MQFTTRLKKAAVKKVDSYNLILECEQCGSRWSPMLGVQGRLPRGYWKCPGGCNSHDIPGVNNKAK